MLWFAMYSFTKAEKSYLKLSFVDFIHQLWYQIQIKLDYDMVVLFLKNLDNAV